MDSLLKIRHDLTHMTIEFTSTDLGYGFKFKTESVWPNPNRHPTVKFNRLTDPYIRLAHHTNVQAYIFQLKMRTRPTNDRMTSRNEGAFEHQHVGGIPTNRDLKFDRITVGIFVFHFENGTTAFIDFVKPDFHDAIF